MTSLWKPSIIAERVDLFPDFKIEVIGCILPLSHNLILEETGYERQQTLIK